MKLRDVLTAVVLLVGSSSMLDAQAGALPQWQLQAARDSFVINVQGQPMGFSVLTVEPIAGGGVRVSENTRIGDMVQQKTELLLDAQQRLTQVYQSGKMRGQDARIAIQYSNSRVKGAATMPGPQGAQSFVIDTPVPANVIDDNLLQSLFNALPWSADANWKIPVFSAGKNSVSEMQLVVTGTEQFATSAGSIEAYRAELRGEGLTVALWVSKQAPQRVLKSAPAGAPFEIVLVN